ncbi:MAG: hypothetical protein WCA46_18675 [Actinocatenispora sp.]
MIVSVAVCPHPPMLVPELAAGAAVDLTELRAACDAAVGTLLAGRPGSICVLGSGPRQRQLRPADHGSFAGYGMDVPVGFGHGGPDGTAFDELSMLVGTWLLGRALAPRPDDARPLRFGQTLPADLPTGDCAALGARLADRSGFHDPQRRVALLVMGDAAARRVTAAPGAPDEESDGFDARALAALRSGDPAALLDLDADLGNRVDASGRAPWQVLAGVLGSRRCLAEVTYAATPLEVSYLVATWRPA